MANMPVRWMMTGQGAPLVPAEFVIITIQQLAGQTST